MQQCINQINLQFKDTKIKIKQNPYVKKLNLYLKLKGDGLETQIDK